MGLEIVPKKLDKKEMKMSTKSFLEKKKKQLLQLDAKKVQYS